MYEKLMAKIKELELLVQQMAENDGEIARYEPKLCSFCGKQIVYAKGYCTNCYNRFRRNGTPEPKIEYPARLINRNEFWERIQERGMESLSEREARVLTKRYRDGMTLSAIGTDEGLTGSRIQQIVKEAEFKLGLEVG